MHVARLASLTSPQNGIAMEIEDLTSNNIVQAYFDANLKRTLFRVVSVNGYTLAEGIDSELLARQIAHLPALMGGFNDLLDLSEQNFRYAKWDFRSNAPGIVEIALDKDGLFEKTFPGAPEEALLLTGLRMLHDQLSEEVKLHRRGVA
jgi:hypothetical protein